MIDVGSHRFEIVRQIGAGGMGVVYEAIDRDTGERVALKTLQHLTGASLYRFKNEFRALKGLYHPNLVRLGELHGQGERWFFTMEFVPGRTLLQDVRPRAPDAERLAELPTNVPASPRASLTDPDPYEHGGDPDDRTEDMPAASVTHPAASAREGATQAPSEVARAGSPASGELDEAGYERVRQHVVQIAEALVVLHDAGKVHRDLKPSNVMVTNEGRIVLLDFGLVMDAFSDVAENTDRNFAGTLAYMAPEQATLEGVGPAADWYALGVLLYQLLTGRLPFVGPPAEILENKRVGHALPVRTLAPHAPVDLAQLAMDLLAPLPKDRPEGREVLRRLVRRARPSSSAPAPSGVDARAALQNLLFGRDVELEALRAMLERAQAGRLASVVVTGEAGLGKTALVQAFVDELRRERTDAIVLRTRCRPDELVPFQAIDGWVDAASHALLRLPVAKVARMLPPRIRLLVDIFPVLRRVPSIDALSDERVELPLDERRSAAFLALRALLAELAAIAPTVLVVDDLHFADRDSLVELEGLVGGESAPPVLLLATCRPFDQPDDVAFQSYGLPANTRRLELSPLTASASRGLVECLHPSVDTASLPALVADAGGHPLHLHELVRHVRTHGGERAASLDDALRARIAELDDTSANVLFVACVSGSPIAEPVLARAAGLGVGQVRAAEGPLEAARFVRTERRGAWVEVEPAHERLRAAMLASRPEEAVRATRERLLEALDAEPELRGRAELFLPHLRALGRSEEAAERLYEAAVAAESRLAFDRAADLHLAALESAELPRELERERRLLAAGCLSWSGRLLPAGEQLERAAMLEPRKLERAELYGRAADTYATAFEPASMQRAATEAMRLLGGTYPSTRAKAFGGIALYLVALLLLPVLAWLPTRRDRSRERRVVHALCMSMQIVSYVTSDLVLATYGTFGAIYHGVRLGPSLERIRGLWMESVVLLSSGLPGLARRRLGRLRDLARALGDHASLGTAHFGTTVALTKLGDYDGAEREAELGLAHGPWMNAFDFVGMTTRIGYVLVLLGHLDRAISWSRRGLSRARLDVEDGMLAMSRDALAVMLAMSGRASDVRERLTHMLATDWSHGRVQVGLGMGLLYCYQDDVDGTLVEALLRAHQTAGVPPRHPADEQLAQYVFAPYVHARRAFAGQQRARKDLAASLPALRIVGRHAGYAPHVPILEAAVHLLDGEFDRAMRLLDRAETLAREINAPFATFEAIVMRVRCLVRMGYERDARIHLRMALALAEEMRWVMPIARVQRELGPLLVSE